MAPKRILTPGRLTASYVVVATAWIVLSDVIVASMHGIKAPVALWQISKGFAFVGVTGLMLHTLMNVMMRRERETAAQLERANRLYATLARANEAALNATDRARLCREICRALVDCAGMRLAWIGWLDRATGQMAIEVAEGPAENYVRGLVITDDPGRPESRGPTGRAIAERRSQVCADIEQDDMMAPWRERALAHGIHSCAAVHVTDGDGTPGTITIYAGEVSYFTPEVVRLVEQLAADLARGLQVLQARHQIQLQSEALRESEQRWQFALEGADEGVWDWDVQSGRVFFSPRLQTMLGYEPGEFRPDVSEWEQRVHPEDLIRTRRELVECLEGRAPAYVSVHRLRCKDGSFRWIRDSGKVMERDASGKPRRMIGTHADVTDRKQAEEALRLSAETTRATFEQAAVGIAHVAPDGAFLRVNRRLCAITGYSEPELLQLRFHDITHPDDLSLDVEHVERMLRGEIQTYSIEKRYVRKDRAVVFVDLTVSLCRNEHGAPAYFISFVQDISAHRESERTRRELLERLQLIAANIPGVIFQYRLRADGSSHFPYASRGIRDIYGVAPEDVLHDATPVFRVLHPDDVEHVSQSIQKSAREQTVWRATYRVNLPSGKTIWVQGQSVPQRFPDGSVLWHGYIHDITERHLTEDRMALLDTALQAVPAGIVVTDREGRIEWVNRGFTQLTGYDVDEATGGNPRLLKSGRHPPDFYRNLWETIQRGEVWSGELINRRKDGSDYHEHMIVAPVSHAREGITHFVAIKQDITEQKAMEAQLLRSQRMEGIGLLAGGIAHDLNNVLAPILLSVELLRLRCTDRTDRRSLDVIESAARRGSGVVRQVLTFARGIDGDRAPLRPRDLVRELVLIIEETFPRDIAIRREIAADTPMVKGDATQLHQVLLNLAVNARDAMPEGGTLTFRVGTLEVAKGRSAVTGEIRPGSYVIIAVGDTGTGMAPEVRDRLFEPFFTTKPRGKGTGLGLPTVLGIVRSHGGFIEVDSQVGAGSEFRICLPAVPDESSEPRRSSATGASLAGAGRTVLVCDDEPSIREVARVILEHAGFKVVEAGNGREAVLIHAERRATITAVVMDIMMPLMTGDRAAAEMLRVDARLPVVFMSGLMEPDAIQAAMKNVGVSRVTLLRKPFTGPELLAALEQKLSESSAASSGPGI